MPMKLHLVIHPRTQQKLKLYNVLYNDLQTWKELANKWLITFSPLETEVMLISNIFHDCDFHLFYDNASLNIVEHHKHVCIHLAANNKRTNHIDTIIDSASKQVSYLRELKY